jgi:hypothetical protein
MGIGYLASLDWFGNLSTVLLGYAGTGFLVASLVWERF